MIQVPNGTSHDEYMNMGITNYILGQGPLQEREYSTMYIDYPLVHIFGAEISLILGHSIIEVSRVVLPVFTILFTLSLYVFFRSVLKNRDAAVLSAVLAIVGNLVWQHFQAFAPIQAGNLLLMILLISAARRRDKITYIVWPALVIAYLPASILFVLVVAGVGVFEKLSTGNFGRTIRQLPYFLGVFLAWNIFWSITTFTNTLDYTRYFVSGGLELSWTSNAAGIISNVPLWAKLTEYFWIAFLPGLGLIIGLHKLFALRKLKAEMKFLLGGLLGTLVFALASAIVVPGGVQWSRIFYYGPIFFAPLVAGFVISTRARFVITKARKRTVLAILISVLIILAFPTFLVQARAVSITVVYGYERSLGSFVGDHVVSDMPRIIVDPATSSVLQYYVPRVQFSTTSSYNLKDMKDIFGISFQGLEILTRKSQAILYFYFGENATNVYFRDITNTAAQDSKVYDSGWTQIYLKR